jgi:hypothetical protein
MKEKMERVMKREGKRQREQRKKILLMNMLRVKKKLEGAQEGIEILLKDSGYN